MMVEHSGFEPLTSSLPVKRSPPELMPRYLLHYTTTCLELQQDLFIYSASMSER